MDKAKDSHHSLRSGRVACLLLPVLLVIAATQPSCAFPPDFNQRPRERIFHLNTSLSPLRNASATLTIDTESPQVSRLRFGMTQEQIQKPFVLRLKLTPGTSRSSVRLNDKPLPPPVQGEDAWYYLIAPTLIHTGDNHLAIHLPLPQQSRSLTNENRIEEIEMASLEDSLEITHFVQMFGSSSLRAQPPAHENQKQFDVLHYDLVIPLNMTETFISSACLTLTARSLVDNLTQVALDLDDNDRRFTVTGVVDALTSTPLIFEHNGDQNRLFINFATPLAADTTFTLRVYYGGEPNPSNNDSLPYFTYLATTHNEKPIVQTFSQPYSARSWWPCKDIPEDKATFSAHITCPLGVTAISNGALLQVTTPTSATQTFHWNESHPIATYLVSVTGTNYDLIEGIYTSLDGLTTMPVAHCVYPESSPANGTDSLEGTLLYLHLLAEMFGEYPFLDEKYYNVVAEFPGAMEHQTCTTMYGPGLNNNSMGLINAHEIAHQWFGDFITMAHYDHLWLNEGFASYCEALVTEKISGKAAYHQMMDNWYTSDIEPILGPDADKFRSSVVYRKAGFVLHMLRHIVGDKVFFQAIRNYLADPRLAYGTALTSDLEAHFEALYGQSLEWFFNQWLTRASRPHYRWAWRLVSGASGPEAHVWVEQTQADAAYIMPVELALKYANAQTGMQRIWIDRSRQTFKVPLDNTDVEGIDWDPENWVLDVEQWGAFPDTALWANAWNIDFGQTSQGGSNTRTLTLENLGNNALVIQNARLEGENATEFRLSVAVSFPQTLLPLAAKQSNIPIYYTPTHVSTAKAQLILETDTGPWVINLTGRATSEWKEVAPMWIVR